MNPTRRLFGYGPGGEEVYVFRLEGKDGAYAGVMNYGALWKSLAVPDRSGGLTEVCLGYDSLREYMEDPYYVGAAVGRYTNRVKNASFTLNGAEYQMQKNDGNNCLHGGFDGYGKRVWDYELRPGAVVFRLRSPDGDQGYPGNLDIAVTYAFDEGNAMTIDYAAQCDRDTPVSLTTHAYFNLSGKHAGSAGQRLRLNSRRYMETDGEHVATGRFLPVAGSAFDYRGGAEMGCCDAHFDVEGCGLREAAVLCCAENGLFMRLSITDPGLQLYTGDFLGAPFGSRAAIALEPQRRPNALSANILKAGERYEERSVYQFGIIT